ncbi:MAG: DUF4912 domain-containing protein [Oculatellaceae cyanobacterium Prado106]|jgi:phosphate transport system substrate-binding protein|nr:DUF4912 domain-containing protein [Oculatellaceae cyanobacterium Prado106]
MFGIMVQQKQPRSLFAFSGLLKATTGATLATSVALGSLVQPLAAMPWMPAIAPATPVSFKLPASVPSGTEVKINTSLSAQGLTESLKQNFEQRFSETRVVVTERSTEEALQAVVDGSADIAAIGRPLLPEEEAQGLVAVPVRREKIAIVLGKDNPFKGEIDATQFSQIFRGEITRWSELGGEDTTIRLVDHPEASDTRQSFSSYPIFQAKPFASGSNTIILSKVNTAALVQALGTDGIGYALAGQVQDEPGVRILEMYSTLPTDPKYPFSQPFSYVYKGNDPSPAVQAFLGYVTAPDAQDAIAQTPIDSASAAGSLTASSANPADANATPAGSASPTEAASGTGSAATGTTDGTTGTAATGTDSTNPGAGILGAWNQTWQNWQAKLPSWLWWLLLPLGLLLLWGLFGGKRRSRPEVLGSETNETWVEPRETSRNNTATLLGAGAAAGAAGAALFTGRSRLTLDPVGSQQLLARWEIPQVDKTMMRRLEGQQMALRLFDVTHADPSQQLNPIQQFTFSEDTEEYQIHAPASDRTYLAELGYLKTHGDWLELARSDTAHLSSSGDADYGRGVATVAAGAAASAAATGAVSRLRSAIQSGAATAVCDYIVLVPHHPEDAYVHWEISSERMERAKQQGGQDLMVRIYDVTGIDITRDRPLSVQQFDCDLSHTSQQVPIPARDRDYVAELGYLTASSQWLRLARSVVTRIPTEWNPDNENQRSIPRGYSR